MNAGKIGLDRGETTSLMQPMRIAESSLHRAKLMDLVLELSAQSAGFRRSLPQGIAHALADLLRAMNCYYSNLIEGHNTHPIDIERALNNDYSVDLTRRNLQLEAKAHVNVQQWIDHGGLQGRELTAASIGEIHQRFETQLPDELLWVTHHDNGKRERVVPGKCRQTDVRVGQHIAISPGAIARFMQHFEQFTLLAI